MKKLLAILIFAMMGITSVFADAPSSIYDPYHVLNNGVLIPVTGSDPQGSKATDGFLVSADNTLRINQVNPMNIVAKTSSQQKIPFSIVSPHELVSIDNFSNEKINVTVFVDAVNPNSQAPNLDILTVYYRNLEAHLGHSSNELEGFQSTSAIIAPGANLQLAVRPANNNGITGSYTIEKVQ